MLLEAIRARDIGIDRAKRALVLRAASLGRPDQGFWTLSGLPARTWFCTCIYVTAEDWQTLTRTSEATRVCTLTQATRADADAATKRVLGVFQSERHPCRIRLQGADKEGMSLYSVFSFYISKPSPRRRLRRMLNSPLVDVPVLKQRHSVLRSHNLRSHVGAGRRDAERSRQTARKMDKSRKVRGGYPQTALFAGRTGQAALSTGSLQSHSGAARGLPDSGRIFFPARAGAVGRAAGQGASLSGRILGPGHSSGFQARRVWPA